MSRSSFKESCLKGRVALVTGGGTGICRGIALRYLLSGCQVAILSRKLDQLQGAAKELEAEASQALGSTKEIRCIAVCADVRKPQEITAAVAEVLKAFGRIDILVNGAAGNFLCAVDNLTLKGFATVMEIDAYGAFNMSQIVHKEAFQKQAPFPGTTTRGTIINISMTLHYMGTLLQTHAGCAKAAIDAMTKHLSVEWGPEGVRVIGVAPGPIEGTEGLTRLAAAGRQSPDSSDRPDPLEIERLIPLQRLGSRSDIADACVFLSLPEASYITGTTLVVDGGHSLTCGNFPLLDRSVMKNWSSKGDDLPGGRLQMRSKI